jgi:hypothetical protein
MTTRSRIGITVAWVSIASSVLFSALYFALTVVFFLSAVFGFAGAMVALAAKARRSALVAAVSGLVPLAELVIEQFFGSEYLVLLPAANGLRTAQ